MLELPFSKIKLTFIGRSGSNHSAFYLCKATSAGLCCTLATAHVQLSVGGAPLRLCPYPAVMNMQNVPSFFTHHALIVKTT